MEGRQKKEKAGCYGHGSFSAVHKTFPMSLASSVLWMGIAMVTIPPVVTICIWGWAALRSLSPHDNLYPQIYIEVKVFPERRDWELLPHHIPPLSFKVTFGELGAGGIDMDSGYR